MSHFSSDYITWRGTKEVS